MTALDQNFSMLTGSTGSTLVGFIAAGAGAVARSVQSKEREIISVTDFYANGVSGVAVDPTGVVDSTLGIQAAWNYGIANNATVRHPFGSYKITSQLLLNSPTPATACRLNLIFDQGSYPGGLIWAGGNNTSVVRSRGWNFSTVENMHIDLGTATGMVGWELDADASYLSTNTINWINCHININNGNGNIGWRMGHGAGWLDVSYMKWFGCTVEGGSGTTQIGWSWEGLNALVFTWVGCFASSLDIGWSGILTSGGGTGQNGGSGMTWVGCGATGNSVDFELPSAGSYQWSGGRYENGAIFVQQGGAGGNAYVFNLDGVEIGAYGTGGEERVFNLQSPTTLNLNGVTANNHTYTAAFITMSISGAFVGSVNVNGGAIQATVDPVYTIVAGGSWQAAFNGVQKLDGSQLAAGYFTNPQVLRTNIPTTVTGAAYTVLETDSDIIANRAGTVTVTLLPATTHSGAIITLRTIQAQTVVSATSNVVPLIGGAAGTAILAATAGKWATLKSDGVNWQIMAGN